MAIPDIGWPHIRCLATCSPKLRTQFADLISLVAAIFQLASHAYKAYQYYILPPIHPSSLFHQTLETEKVSNHLVADMAYDLALFHASTRECLQKIWAPGLHESPAAELSQNGLYWINTTPFCDSPAPGALMQSRDPNLLQTLPSL